MSRFRKILPTAVSLGVLIVTVFTASVLNKKESNNIVQNNVEDKEVLSNTQKDTIKSYKNKKEQDGELRAVWIPFMDLQVKGEFSEENFKQNYKDILSRTENAKLNTVFVQIRPFSDAFYPSKIFPWSHMLTGVQGKDPGFDPLKFMIDETHERNLEFHAWIVPMRIKNARFPNELSDLNPYVKWKRDEPDKFNKYVVEDKEYTYYDPAYEEVRQMIVNGVKEIVENYDVDGVNFDDYFYPSNNLWVDAKDYGNTVTNTEAKDESEIIKKRKDNINSLISETYSAIKSIKDYVDFGVCPQGNFDNARRGGADIDTWASSEGYVDYLCPEIYTNSVNPVLPFEKAASDWRKLTSCNKIKLYAGLGLYKTGTSEYDKGTWLTSDDIIMKQIEHLRKEKFDGFSLYSSVYLDKLENKKEVSNVIKIIS